MYELFEQLMKQLLVAKPERPLDFLIDRLNEEPSKFETSLILPSFPVLVKRVFLLGPPGSFRQENASHLKEFFPNVIHTGDLLKDEAKKKTD